MLQIFLPNMMKNHYLVFEENDRIQILNAVKQYFYFYQSEFTKEMSNDMKKD